MKLDVGDIFYSIGERVEKVVKRIVGVMKMMFKLIFLVCLFKLWLI